MNYSDFMNNISDFEWAEEINAAVTVCDAEGIILFMNKKSRETFAGHGDLIGKNLFNCHSRQSQDKIRHMLATGESNSYTISKQGKRKMIYQTPWRKDGKISGMVEISMVIPEDMPHYIR